MIPTCSWCGRWIERGNRNWPGYCSPWCRDRDRHDHDRRRKPTTDCARPPS